jgi:hypothetical protein
MSQFNYIFRNGKPDRPAPTTPALGLDTINNIVYIARSVQGQNITGGMEWVPLLQLSTNGSVNAVQDTLNLQSGAGVSLASDSNGNVTISSSSAATVEVNGTPLLSSGITNFENGNDVTVSNPSAGNVKFDFSGILAQSLVNATHKWLNSYDAATGLFTQTQPAYTDLTGFSPELAIDNDTMPSGPTPQATQASPLYQDSTASGGAPMSIQVASNVLTAKIPNVFAVGETVKFRNLNSSTFLNNQSVVVASVAQPTATITNVSWSGNVLTVTCANTFTANQEVYLAGLTTNTKLNGTVCTVATASGTQFTATLRNATITNGAETGTVTSFENSQFTASFTHADIGPTNNTAGTVGVLVNPFLWVYDTFNQNWFDQAFIDTQYAPPGGPVGRFTFSRPFAYNDTGAPSTGIKQAMVDINHRTGNSVGNFAGGNAFDVALGIVNENASNDTKNYGNVYSIYLETRLHGTPTYFPFPGEDSASGARFVCVDYRSTSASALSSNYGGVSGSYSWVGDGGSGTMPVPGGVQVFGGRFSAANSSNNGAGITLNGAFVGVSGTAADVSAGGPSASGIGYGGFFQASNFSSVNAGVNTPDHGSGLNNWDAIFTGGSKDSGKVGINTLIMGGNTSGHASVRTARASQPGTVPNLDVAGKLPFSDETQTVTDIAVLNNEVYTGISLSGGQHFLLVNTEAAFAALGAATFLNSQTIKVDSSSTSSFYTAPFTHANYGNVPTNLSLTSNVLTVTCPNSYAPGDIVRLNFATSDPVWGFLGGVALTVNAGGLSGSQFTANKTHADVASSAPTGTVIVSVPESTGSLAGNLTCSYTFTETYTQNPMVFITPALPSTTTFTVSALSTSGFTVTASAGFLGIVNYFTVGQN